jgi:hypothetical protein
VDGWRFGVLRFRLMVETRSALSGLKHQKEKRSMDHFAGLDVSVKETSVCIVDDTGKIVREVKVATEPDALLAVLTNLSMANSQIFAQMDRPGQSCEIPAWCYRRYP